MAWIQVGITTRTGYPRDNDAVQQLLAYANGLEEGTPFFRMETSQTQTLNDSARSTATTACRCFNSSAVVFNRFSHSLGLSAWPGSNRYAYYESTPFANTMCAIKYLLNRSRSRSESPYTVSIASAGRHGSCATSPISRRALWSTRILPISSRRNTAIFRSTSRRGCLRP